MKYSYNVFIENLFSYAQKNPNSLAFSVPKPISFLDLSLDINQKVKDLNSIPGLKLVLLYHRPTYDAIITLFALLKLNIPIATCHRSFSHDKMLKQVNICNASHILCDNFFEFNSSSFRQSKITNLYQYKEYSPQDLSDLAAIFFTSGSSKDPKGVRISLDSHNYVFDVLDSLYKIKPNNKILVSGYLGSDYGVYNILFPLSKGAHLFIIDNITNISLEKCIIDYSIEIIQAMPPILLEIFKPSSNYKKITSLKIISTTGQKMPYKISKNIIEQGIELYLMYGMTECKRIFSPFTSNTLDSLHTVGYPVLGTNIYLDPMKNDQISNIGELCVNSMQLTDGYCQNIDSHKFIEIDGRRYFRTGDIFKETTLGFEHLGRVDHFFPHYGFMVNPKEIVECVYIFDDIIDADIYPKKNKNGSYDVYLIVQINRNSFITKKIVLDKLQTMLDWYMIPKEIIFTFQTLAGKSGKNNVKRFLKKDCL